MAPAFYALTRVEAHGKRSTICAGHIEINANAMAATPNAVFAGTLDQGLAIYNIGVGPLDIFHGWIALAQRDGGGGARRRAVHRNG